MLYRKDGKWQFSPFIVKYEQRGEEMTAHTHDKQWWERFAEKWDHTEIFSFEDAEYTDAQKARLQEVENTPDGFEHYAGIYALTGKFPDELDEDERFKDHPFKILQLEKENQTLGQSLTEAEIKNFFMENDMGQLGQQLTDLELQILMQGME